MVTNRDDEQILIIAPIGRDALLLQTLLKQEGFRSTIVDDNQTLSLHIEAGIGALLLTEEALASTGLQQLREALVTQPEWSNVPLVLLVDESTHPQIRKLASAILGADKKITFLERPVSPKTLIEVMQAALWVRRRQYQTRNLLTQLAVQNEALAREVAERQRTEAALRESEERLRAALVASETGTFRWDIRTNALYWDESLARLFGLALGQTIHTLGEFIALIHPDDQSNVLERMTACAQAGADFETEFRVTWPDGSLHWLYDRGKTFLGADGRPIGMTGACTEITARKHAEAALRELNLVLEQRVAERTAELERSNRELDQFAYVASHDLKAPLRAISNLANWITEDAAAVLPSASQAHLTKLQSRIKRMETLLNDLLAYSRAGRQRHTLEPVDTATLIKNVVDLLSPPTGFVVTVENKLPLLVLERVPLETVFRNLIGNAIKHHHAPNTGRVHVTALDQEPLIEFIVRDNGPGIDPVFHERIFQIFQTLKSHDDVEGSGMGLAVVKKAVEHRGGAIRVESSLGQGATFRFTWPKGQVVQHHY